MRDRGRWGLLVLMVTAPAVAGAVTITSFTAQVYPQSDYSHTCIRVDFTYSVDTSVRACVPNPCGIASPFGGGNAPINLTAGVPVTVTGCCPAGDNQATLNVYAVPSSGTCTYTPVPPATLAPPETASVFVGPELLLGDVSVIPDPSNNMIAYRARVCNAGLGDAPTAGFRVGLWFDSQSKPAAQLQPDRFGSSLGLTPMWSCPGGCDNAPSPLCHCDKCGGYGNHDGECYSCNLNVGAWTFCHANAPQPDATCVAWRETAGCLASGAREDWNDKDCDTVISTTSSGYCECSTGYYPTDCNHDEASCGAVCATGAWNPWADSVRLSENALGKSCCCEDVIAYRGPPPKTSMRSWLLVDSDNFVRESIETNNWYGPLELKYPELVVSSFQANVSYNQQVTYQVRVCNVGRDIAYPFYVDIYYDRDKAPTPGITGDQRRGPLTLDPGACLGPQQLTFYRESGLIPGATYRSYVQVDADAFQIEPNKTNNVAQTTIKNAPPLGCVDADHDGYGVGLGCSGPQDCNDNDPTIHPYAQEIIGDGIDNNCNGTTDEGQPGMDCVDQDGDGWPAGPDCQGPQDCNDNDPLVHPGQLDACGNNIDDNCDGNTDENCPGRLCDDADHDGYGVGPGCSGPQDCDDNDPSVHPGAVEICGDGIDQNCNNVVDEGCDTCVDTDGDGYFVGGGCLALGIPFAMQDCDDHDPGRHPGAAELCDGIDNNCNGSIDEGCPGVRCEDADGDGWPVGPDCQGQQDCDDLDPFVHPGQFDVCGDGIDNNCDGTPDDGCPGVDCQDRDGDGWPSGPDCALSDCDDSDPAIHPYAVEICRDGKDNNCDGTTDEGCPSCEDKDGDGFFIGPDCPIGAGLGCPYLLDCDDNDPNTNPGAQEICGDGKDNNCNGLTDEGCPGVPCSDSDCDGFGYGPACPGPQDCNDQDATIHPRAQDICGNGVDDNCDGVIDEGCASCLDEDGDGYYVGGGCLARGITLLMQDCDDHDPNRHPGAAELCDGIDNNCNGSIDEGCPGVRCEDLDGDGWPAGPDCQGYQDCDELDPTTYPGAPEVCGDGKDNNCNLTVDDGCPGVDCVDHDGDNWPSGADCRIGDCADYDPSIHPGARDLCDGIDRDCDGRVLTGCAAKCVDADGDGFSVGTDCPPGVPQDCDDSDPNVYPGAPESCQHGKDTNCDGVVAGDERCGGCDCGNPGGGLPGGRDGGRDASALIGLLALGARRRRSRAPRP